MQENTQITADAPMTAPKLDDTWKARMLDGQPLARDKDGIGYHPALPDFDEGVKCADFFNALGIELKCGMAENEMDSDAYEAMTENGLTEDGDNYNAWTPARPEGEGWSLVAVFDTEDGPACWWMRDKPFVPQRQEGYRERTDNAAVEVLAMNMKAKLAGQRAKGYRGWNNDCTQQYLSDLLRECVEKGDPVDVANFCAFLLSRGETIASKAEPVDKPEGDYLEGVNIPNLRKALIFLGRENGAGEGEVGSKLAQYVNSIVSGVLRCKETLQSADQAAPAKLAVTPTEDAQVAAELVALRDVYEQARGVLRHDGIDTQRAFKYRDGLINAIEAVKVIDGGNWEPPEGTPVATQDEQSEYQRGYKHGYNRRDAEVKGALA